MRDYARLCVRPLSVRVPSRVAWVSALACGCTLAHAQSIVSNFDTDDEGWKLAGDSTTSSPAWLDTGGNPGG